MVGLYVYLHMIMYRTSMNTKEKILQVAFKTFLNKGYENTSMNDLVQATGISKGSFYYYFSNKKALYNAIIDRFFLSFYKTIKWEEYENLSFVEIDKKIKSFYINFVNEINQISNNGLASYYIMFFEACKLHPKFINEIQQFYFQLKRVIDQSIKKDKLKINSVSIIAKYEGILFWILIFPKEKIEKLIKQL